MGADPSVIAALQAAVGAAPRDVPLRVHLAGLLLGAGDPRRALEEAAAALALEPADTVALAIARDAAALTGDEARAAGYSRLLAALRGDEGAAAEPAGRSADPRDDDPRLGRPLPADHDEEQDGDHPSASAWQAIPVAGGPTLADVGGMEEVKRRLDVAFLGPLRNPELGALYGTALRGGLLLYGPPGCGKTFLARAIAGELDASFLTVGISDVLDMYLGESERRLHEVFEAAREAAPCVLFLDELDALGRKRSQMRASAGRTLVNQLLQDLDGAVAANDGLFVLAATNHPWDVDTALRRPGRLDRTLLVLPPDAPARTEILARALRSRSHDARDLADVVARTDGYSGADLVQLVDVAAQEALQDALDSGVAKPISVRGLLAAAKDVRASTRSWFSVAYNHAVYANEAGEYDDLLTYIRERRLR